MSVDTKEGPGDSDGTSEITLGRGECVSSGGGLEDEEGEEDEDLGPDSGAVRVGVATECLETGEEDKDGGPAVVEGEGKVDED